MLVDRGQVDDVQLMDSVGMVLGGQERIAELEAEVAQLREALTRRQQYGVVTGLLALRYGLPPERAWQLVIRMSQHSNLKVQVVARVIHDRFFGRLSPEDKEIAVRLDAQIGGHIGPLTPVGSDGSASRERG